VIAEIWDILRYQDANLVILAAFGIPALLGWLVASILERHVS
jgi:hypothetical protein